MQSHQQADPPTNNHLDEIPNDPTAQFWWMLVHQPVQIQFATLSSPQPPTAIAHSPPIVEEVPSIPLQQQQQQQTPTPSSCLLEARAHHSLQQQEFLLRYHHQEQPALIDSMSTMTASEVLDDDPSTVTEEFRARHNHHQKSFAEQNDEENNNKYDNNDNVEGDDDDEDSSNRMDQLGDKYLPQQQQQHHSRRRRRQRKLWVAASPPEESQDYLEVAMASSTVSAGAADHTTPVFQMLLQYSPSILKSEENASAIASISSDVAKCNSIVSTLVHEEDEEEDDEDHDDDDDREIRAHGDQHHHQQQQQQQRRCSSNQSSTTRDGTGTGAAPSNRSSPFARQGPTSTTTTTTTTTRATLQQRGGEQTTTNRDRSMARRDRPSLELQLSTTFDEAMDEVALLLDQVPSQPNGIKTQPRHNTKIQANDMVLSDEAYRDAIQRAEQEVEKALQHYRTTTTTAPPPTGQDPSSHPPPPAQESMESTTSSRPSSRRSSKGNSSSSSRTTTNHRNHETDDHSHHLNGYHQTHHHHHHTPSSTKSKSVTDTNDEVRQDGEATPSTKRTVALTCSIPTPSSDSRLLSRQSQQDVTPRKAEMERRHREQLDQLRVSNMEELSAAKACYEQETERIRQDYERNFRTQLYRLELVKERQIAFLQEQYKQDLEETTTRSQEQMQKMKQELKMKLVDLCRETFEREKRQAVEEAVADLSKQLQEAREHAVLLEQERLSLLEEIDRSARQTKLQHEMDLDMVKRKVREHVEELKSLQLLEIQSLHMEKDEAIVMATKSATEFAQVGRELIAQLKRKLDSAQQKVRLLLKEKKEVAEENDLVVEAIRGEHAMVQRGLKDQIARLKRQLERQAVAAKQHGGKQAGVIDSRKEHDTIITRGPGGSEAAVDNSTDDSGQMTAVLTRENELIRQEKEAALEMLEDERLKRSRIVNLLAQRSQQANLLLDDLCKSHESAVAEASRSQEEEPRLVQSVVIADTTPIIESKFRPSPKQRDKTPNRKSMSEGVKKVEQAKHGSQPIKTIVNESAKSGPHDVSKRSLQEPVKRMPQESARRIAQESQKILTPRSSRSSPNSSKRGTMQSSPGILGASPKLVFHGKEATAKPTVTTQIPSAALSLIQKLQMLERQRLSKVCVGEDKTPATNTETSRQTAQDDTSAKSSNAAIVGTDNPSLAFSSASTEDVTTSDSISQTFDGEGSSIHQLAIKSSPSYQTFLTSSMTENDSNIDDGMLPRLVSKMQTKERDVFKSMQPSAADLRLPTTPKSPRFNLQFEETSHCNDLSTEGPGVFDELLPGISDVEGVDEPFTLFDDDMTIDSRTWESAFVEKPVSVKKRVALYEYLASASSSVSETSSNAPLSIRKNQSPSHHYLLSAEIDRKSPNGRRTQFDDV